MKSFVPPSAHIGFYVHEGDPIGQFQSLLYLPFRGGWEDTVDPLRAFFAGLPPEWTQGSEPGRVATALKDYLVRQRGQCSVEWASELQVEIEWYYKVCLNNSGWLEVFEVKYLNWDASVHPDGDVILWGLSPHNVALWLYERYPCNWKLALGVPLWCRADLATADG